MPSRFPLRSCPPSNLTMGQPDLCSVTMVFSLRECHMKGIIQYVTLWDQLFSLSIIPSHFIQAAACINSLLLSIVRSIPWCVTCHILLIRSPAEEHLRRFKFLVVMNRVAINIHCRFVCDVSLLQGKHPGIGLLGRMESTFNFNRNCQTICPKRLHHSSLPPAISESFNCSAYMMALGVARIFYFSHSSRC